MARCSPRAPAYYTFIAYDRQKSNEHQAKSNEHGAKSNEQQATSKKFSLDVHKYSNIHIDIYYLSHQIGTYRINKISLECFEK